MESTRNRSGIGNELVRNFSNTSMTTKDIISTITEFALAKLPENVRFIQIGDTIKIETTEQKFTIIVHEVKR